MTLAGLSLRRLNVISDRPSEVYVKGHLTSWDIRVSLQVSKFIIFTSIGTSYQTLLKIFLMIRSHDWIFLPVPSSRHPPVSRDNGCTKKNHW